MNLLLIVRNYKTTWVTLESRKRQLIKMKANNNLKKINKCKWLL